jgi:putative membrane-bound dehydrogenase-like protein
VRIAAVWLSVSAALGQGYPPDQAVARMKVADGFRVKLVASEPQVRQPILVKFDERGRLWVIQYLQYPNPAGLRRVAVDRYSRTTYDRVPPPPPRGPKGADRITILEDTDGDGRADKFTDFATGLNLATGLALGHGGVFVLQVPYLLYYPDRNRDDIPDSDPEVLLEGFGMEDSQSLANHLTWGPDGWLYGLNGSTTTCRIRGVEFQQGVWRYHPVTREFELFAEGGGNIYGLAFDATGNLFYSSNGASLFWHAVQGAYYQKSFGKHGPLHNPHAYGHFPHVKHDGVPGGHVVLGGLIYSGESFPSVFRETFVGGNFLGRSVAWWSVSPLGSTVEAKLGGLLFDANDTWFCPTDLAQAPDGSIYVCDFHDARTAHPDPDAEWDRRNGRVYRVEAVGTRAEAKFDLAKLSSAQLVSMLGRSNRWYADQARPILAARRDPATFAALREMAGRPDSRMALEGLWSLHAGGGLDDATAAGLARHPSEHVRAWLVRLRGDSHRAPGIVDDPSPVVRAQLAASAKRLSTRDALPVLRNLWSLGRDQDDPHIPLLAWWAMERHAMPARREMVAAVDGIAPDLRAKLMRRYAAEGSPDGYDACADLLARDPTLLPALEQGLGERGGMPVAQDTGVFLRFQQVSAVGPVGESRRYAPVGGRLLEAIRAAWAARPADSLAARVAIRAGVEGAHADVARRAAASRDVKMLAVLQELGEPSAIPHLLPLLDAPTDVAQAAIAVLARFDDEGVTRSLIAHHAKNPTAIQRALLSRASSTAALLDAVERGMIDAKSIPSDELKRVAAFGQPRLDALVRKHWGAVAQGTPEEKLATVRRLSNDLRAGQGDRARGRNLYLQHCGACHRLNGEGGTLGMDLTAANRADRLYLLTHIVDPSAFIRKEYMTVEIRTRDGRVLSGLVADEDAGGVALVDAGMRRTRIAGGEIERRSDSPVSVMPEGLLEKLSPQSLRDLFAHLEAR